MNVNIHKHPEKSDHISISEKMLEGRSFSNFPLELVLCNYVTM